MFNALVRVALGLLGTNPDVAPDGGVTSSFRVDKFFALWVRDWRSQPATYSVNITTGSDHGLTFRAIRFDGAAGVSGAVVCDLRKADGSRDAAVTQNVVAGEVWARDSDCVPKIVSLPAGITARGEG